MNSLEIFRGLDNHFQSNASFSINFGKNIQGIQDTRDTPFTINIERLREQNYDLAVEDITDLLPIGSVWLPALNMHSYVIRNFYCQKKQHWLVISAVVVEPHPTRQAVPYYRGYVFSSQKTALEEMIEGLKNLAKDIAPDLVNYRDQYLYYYDISSFPYLIYLNNVKPEDNSYKNHKARILYVAAKEYESQIYDNYYSTLILNKDEMQRVYRKFGDKYLVGYFDSIFNPNSSKVKNKNIDHNKLLPAIINICNNRLQAIQSNILGDISQQYSDLDSSSRFDNIRKNPDAQNKDSTDYFKLGYEKYDEASRLKKSPEEARQKYSTALEYFKKAIKLDENNVQIYGFLANIYLAIDEKDLALHNLEQVYKRSNDMTEKEVAKKKLDELR
ncbi:hypothetical protein NIES2109_64770 (plasmid) [Nostoc sp. HK-01]|nr:hypothetical protein NIES2109_64770 [Nostoc sp. HK-01]